MVINKRSLTIIFILGVLVGVILTSVQSLIKEVLAVRPIRTDAVNYYGGFYKDLNNARLTGDGSGIFLAYHDFTGFNFTNADLQYDNLVETKFIDADINGANFTGANLTNAYFTGTKNTNLAKWYQCSAEGGCGTTTCPDGSSISTPGATCVDHLFPTP